jgi:hypothetical protein
MPAEFRISHTVDAAIVWPSFASSPWMRRCPHVGFSLASRSIKDLIAPTIDGRPTLADRCNPIAS